MKPTKLTRYDVYEAVYDAMDKLTDPGRELIPSTTMKAAGLDSIDRVELIVTIEDELNVHLPDDCDECMTLADVTDRVWHYVELKQNKK